MTKQERATRTRRALIHSAATVIERHGYAEARLVLISSGAGVSTGALHFHFENKAAIAEAVVTEALRGLAEVSGTIRHRTDTALQALVDTSHAVAELLREDPVTRAGFRISCDGEGSGAPDLRAEWLARVQDLLADAAAAGTLAEGVSRADAAAATVAVTTGFEVLGRHDSGWLSPQTLTGFWHLLLPRLAAPDVLALLDPSGPGAKETVSGHVGSTEAGAPASRSTVRATPPFPDTRS
ncbi:ScbR family autoregulator-binding transcription factor [Streptomyces sp. NPDC101181]|uniref:ScbR family autoregulator-binding transcription factor n=1 Tax=Streptomyces sp. NPDC101181 TaxID=3366125 RepID=UPI00382AA31D